MQFLDFLTQPIPGFPTMLNVNSKREADTNNISSRKSKSNTTSHSEDDNEEESNKKGQTEKKKPGRKPTQIDPSNKRTAQNRAAQRAFRERKEKYLSDLETKVRELEEANKLSKGESTLKLIQENKQLKETIENLRTENSMLKDMQFTFDYPVADNQKLLNQLSSHLSSPPSTIDATSPFSESLFTNNISDFNLFSNDSTFNFDSNLTPPPNAINGQSAHKDELFSFNSSDIFSNTGIDKLQSLNFGLYPTSTNTSSPTVFNEYREHGLDSIQLETDNTIDKLLDTADLPVETKNIDVKEECPLVDKQLKEQVQRVITDPSTLNELCEMFSSKASCNEFVKLKERVAIAIIQEDKNEVIAQPSRKGKKAWRKNVDITKIEEGLSEINEELRTTGEKLHKVSDSSLFSIDKSGDTQLKKKLKSKPLKYQQILTPDSSVPMLLSRCHPVSSNVREMIYGKKKRIISRTTLKSIQKAVEKLEKNKKIFSVKNTSASHNKHKKNGVDIWGENAVPKVAPENEFIDEIIKPFKKKKPALPETRSKHVESVKLAENGQSYNPSFKEHQVTLQEAVDEELRIADLNNKLEELVSFPSELNELNEEMDVDVSGDEIEEDNVC
ncbi:hypothetical protein HK099_006226 [Clydaea vesicula]|uniref:Ribosome biogenesis protein NOP53 n=1 Tax=Clydaea vesicula TaxID=447962 RepID=A0AAD5TYH3_9FUNG|nr:hypothetical protein HK099_006226 [Clydaea vesicula]